MLKNTSSGMSAGLCICMRAYDLSAIVKSLWVLYTHKAQCV